MRSRPTASDVTRPDPASQSATSAVPAVAALASPRRLPGPRSDSLPTEVRRARYPTIAPTAPHLSDPTGSMGLECYPVPRTLIFQRFSRSGAYSRKPDLSGPTGEPDGRHGYGRRSSMEHVSVQLEQRDPQLVVPAEEPDIEPRSQNLSAPAVQKNGTSSSSINPASSNASSETSRRTARC